MKMVRSTMSGGILVLLFLAVPALGQHHISNWVLRSATDTTVVRCQTDSLTMMGVPPNSMNMMMMPDSMFLRIDRMPMDSLRFPHDSTFIGWCRVRAGTDSIHFSMMNTDSISGMGNMMQFGTAVYCQFRWDDLMADSMHRRWQPTGVKGWSGSGWVSLTGVTFSGYTAAFSTARVYSGFAFVGTSGNPVAVEEQRVRPFEYVLGQNYPNPFNPSATIPFSIANAGFVTLDIYNILGQKMESLVSGTLPAGSYTARFNGGRLPSGVYLYRLTAGNFVQTKKLVLAK